MRVISGNHKGRAIKPVPHQLTRPTTDKVKEAIFQIIGPYFNGGMCLDLFAGSGGLGIEAISRGIEKTVFVDQHPKAIKTIYQNLQLLNIEEQAEVYRTNAFRALKAAGKRELKFSLIFLDPPYGKISYEDLLYSIEENHLLVSSGIIVCEHQAEEKLADKIGQFSLVKSETYGNTTSVSFYKYKEE